MARKSRRQNIDTPAVTTPAGKVYKTAVYARLSVEDSGKQDGGDSIENQVYLIKQFIGERPFLNLTAVYSDNGETGVNFDRPQFNKMMDDVKAKKIDCIVVKDLSRFGRNYIETGNYLEKIFPFLGIRFISVNDNYDNNDPDSTFDSLSISLKSLINDVYAKDISRKVTAALETKQQNGEFIGSHAAYGYLKSPENRHKLVVDEATAPVVRDIFRWKLEGMGNNVIARKLNDMGVLAPSRYRYEKGIVKDKRYANVLWVGTVIKSILLNPVYTGCLSQGKQKTRLLQGLCNERTTPDKWVIVPDTHEAIVSAETFAAVGEILDGITAAYHEKAGKYAELGNPENLFKRIIRCADCGTNLTRYKTVKPPSPKVNKPAKVYFHYICPTYEINQTRACKCKKSLNEEVLIDTVWETIKAEMDLCADTVRLVQKIQKNSAAKSKVKTVREQTAEVRRKINRCDTLLSSLYDDYTENILTEAEYLFARAKYREEKRLLQLKEDELIAVSVKHSGNFVEENKWVTALLRFNNEKQLTRAMLAELVDHVTVAENNRIGVTLKHRDEYEALLNFISESEAVISA